jgi:hypothetical protein
MATTTEKYYILQEVKTTDGQPAPEPGYAVADRLVKAKMDVNFAGLAGIFVGLDLSK